MSKDPRLLRFLWKDGVFVPDGLRMAAYCDQQFGEGEVVTFERHEPRSTNTHNHYFACLNEAFNNLPEGDARFPSVDALRKWALIKNNYCTKTEIVASDPQQAALIAAFTGNAEGVIIVVKENVVVKYTAKSQSMKAMGAQEFQRSKVDTLDTIAELLGLKRRELEKNSGRAA